MAKPPLSSVQLVGSRLLMVKGETRVGLRANGPG
jgi:hypothetical protein